MSKKIATGAFNDTECTCDCGNKHELYCGEDTIQFRVIHTRLPLARMESDFIIIRYGVVDVEKYLN